MRIDPAVRDALDATGLPWELRRGKRHQKIILDGRFVGILPHDCAPTGHQRALKATLTQIRRAARGEATKEMDRE